jgi:hypothetical protein
MFTTGTPFSAADLCAARSLIDLPTALRRSASGSYFPPHFAGDSIPSSPFVMLVRCVSGFDGNRETAASVVMRPSL